MKDYIEDQHGDIEKPSYNQLREWVWEAWDAVPEDWLKELLASMPLMRCEAVIKANGMHTNTRFLVLKVGLKMYRILVAIG
jgi:hypothetical protein